MRLIVLAALAFGLGAQRPGKPAPGGQPGPPSRRSEAAEPVYYVAPNGTDAAGNGSLTSPWATIGYATSVAPDTGVTIMVRDGTYAGSTGIRRRFKNWCRVRAENRYQARLRHNTSNPLYFYGASHVIFEGFDVARTDPADTGPLLVHIFNASDHLILVDNIFHDSMNNDLLKVNEESSHLVFLRNLFYNQQGGAGQHIDLNGTTDAFVVNNLHFSNQSPNLNNTNHYVMVKDSDGTRKSRRHWIVGNVMLNWEGSIGSAFIGAGEDGLPFYETQDLYVLNNLMLRNSPHQQRSAFNLKGVKNILYANNSAIGGGPAHEAAFRANAEGTNPANDSVRFYNNIWATDNDRSAPYQNASPSTGNSDFTLLNNLYWNAGMPIQTGCGNGACTNLVEYSDDPAAIAADPKFPSQDGLVLPIWGGTAFESGTPDIWSEAKRIITAYGVPDSASSALNQADPRYAPYLDILNQVRGIAPDNGAVQHDADPAPVYQVIVNPPRTVGGSSSEVSVVVFDSPVTDPAGADVQLTSSETSLVAVPPSVHVPAGSTVAPFSIRTQAVRTEAPVYIDASYTPPSSSPVLFTARITLTPETVSIGLNAASASSGAPFKMSVSSGGPAPSPDGYTVSLSTDRPDLLALPESIVIPAGEVNSKTVEVETYPNSGANTVHITATVSATSSTQSLTLTPAVLFVDLPTPDFYPGKIAGNKVRIPLYAPPGGVTVSLASDNPAAASVPASVTVPEGRYSAPFEITASNQPARTFFRITASYGGATASARASVLPVTLFLVSASAAVWGGDSFGVTVRLNVPTSVPAAVPLSASPGGVLSSVADRIVVPAGMSIYTAAGAARCNQVMADTRVTLGGAYNGVTREQALTCLRVDLRNWYAPAGYTVPVGVQSLYLFLGTASYLPALTIDLTSSDPTIANPTAPLVVQKGADRAIFNVNFLKAGTVTLTATTRDTGKQLSATFVVR